jgi:hypothetical protein
MVPHVQLTTKCGLGYFKKKIIEPMVHSSMVSTLDFGVRGPGFKSVAAEAIL